MWKSESESVKVGHNLVGSPLPLESNVVAALKAGSAFTRNLTPDSSEQNGVGLLNNIKWKLQKCEKNNLEIMRRYCEDTVKHICWFNVESIWYRIWLFCLWTFFFIEWCCYLVGPCPFTPKLLKLICLSACNHNIPQCVSVYFHKCVSLNSRTNPMAKYTPH